MNSPSRFIKEIDQELLEIENEKMMPEEQINREALYHNEGEVEFHENDIVMHMIYGRGVVIEVVGNFITVAFAKNFGIKKLLKNHKSIKKI